MFALLREVSALLSARGTPHALAGAAALAVHGVSRSTVDVDVVTTDPAVLREETWAEVRALGAAVSIRQGDEADPLRGVVRLSRTGDRPVDVVVGRAGWQAELVARARPVAVGGGDVPVVDAAALVLLKLFAGGPQDAWDVTQLVEAVGLERVAPGVEAVLPRLPPDARELWLRVRAGAPCR